MNRDISPVELCRAIQQLFHRGLPNGWLLGWDTNRGYAMISEAASPHETVNHTTFDYGYCNWYDVRFENKSDFWTLTIKLSFIVPVYCAYWTYYETTTRGSVIPFAPDQFLAVEKKLRIAVENAGFDELPDALLDMRVPDVELELSSVDDVTLSKCLFNDYAG